MRTIDQLEKVTSAEDAALLVINNAAATSTNAITFSDLKSQVLDGNAASATKAVSADSATDAGKATNDANGNKIDTTYAPIASPVFTGTPKVPTPNGDSVDTQAANKKYVNDQITSAVNTAKTDIQNSNVASATNATNDANGNKIDTTYAKLVSPSFTGSPAVPTPDDSSADIQAANKKYVNDRITEAIGNVIQFKVDKVDVLPDVSAGEANTIYFVPASNTADNNIFNEFMLINGKWEQIGSSVVTLPASLPASGVADEADMDYGDLDS